MALKYTIQFNWLSSRGWTETFYTTASTAIADPAVTDFVKVMAAKRAACLSNKATILSCRVSDPAAPALVRGVEVNVTGTAGNGFVSTDGTDVVNLAALVNFFSATGVRRSYLMRGLTDADVVGGELTCAFTGRPAYNRWWDWVSKNTAVRDVVNGPFKDVATVSGLGLITTAVALGAAANNVVLVKSRTAGNGPKVRASGVVQSAPGALTVQLKRWTRGDCVGGQACLTTVEYRAFTSFSLVQPPLVRTRQTGHPFGLLRGRQSAR